MDKEENKLLTVGELARKGGVTVRTLQYYDTNGLLIPSEYSDGGRRMYTKGDPELIQNMFEVGSNDDNWPLDTKDLKEATKSFLGQAISTYLKNNDIKLPFMEGK